MTAAALPLDPGLREIRLYGVLGRKFGRVHRMAVTSVREAMQALAVVLPGFAQHLLDGRNPGYQIFLGQRGKNNVPEAQLDYPVSAREAICVVPVVQGAKSSAGMIIAGAALLVLAPYAAGALFATGTAFGTAAAIGIAKFSGSIAASLILGGVVGLISEVSRGSPAARPEGMPSYNFDGPVNLTQEGMPVPLRYGRVLCGASPISQGILTEDIKPAAAPAPMPPQTLPDHEPLNPIEDSVNYGGGA